MREAGLGSNNTGVGGRRRISHLIAYALLIVSCDNPLSPETKTVGRIELQPSVVNLTVGASASLRAEVIEVGGSTLTGRRVFWSSEDSTIASVSQTGTVTAQTSGVVRIAASSGGKAGMATITVTPRPVRVVRVTPENNQLTVGHTVALVATALDAGGLSVPVETFIWTSSSDAIASVSSTGVVTAVSEGNATISARVESISGSATVSAKAVPIESISITPPSGTVTVAQNLQLRATPVDALGNVLNGRNIAWGSSDNAIATVSSTGLVVGLAPGKATITARSEEKAGTADITVKLVPIDNISISPSAPDSIAPGQTLQLTPTARDANGKVLVGRTFTWTSDQPTIATVDSNGVVTGVAHGSAGVRAEAEGKSAVATVNVKPVLISSIEVTPDTVSLSINATAQLTATAKDAQGDSIPGRKFTWITGAKSVATVSQTGLVTAVGVGNAIIFAGADQVSGSSSITVSSVHVARVVVSPSTSNVTVGGFVQLSATMLDAQGNTLTGRQVTWSSSNDTIAVVTGNGRVLSRSAGTVTITATSDNIDGTATVTTNNVPVASVLVTPSNATMVVGQATTFLATPRDAQGNPLIGRVVTWLSSSPAVAMVNGNGDVSANGPGTATLSATCESIQGFATITVTSIPVASVIMTPGGASLSPGQTQLMTVTVRDASNNLLSGRTVTFTSTIVTAATVAPAAASTDAAGQAFTTVTAVGNGATTITAASGSVQANSTINVITVVTSVASVALSALSPADSVIPPLTASGTATVADGAGNPLSGRLVAFTSSQPSRATVTAPGISDAAGHVPFTVTGIADAAGPVTVNITATSESKTSPAVPVKVRNPVSSVNLTATADTVIGTGGTITTTTTLTDAFGNPISGRPIAFTSSNQSVATVHATSGLITSVGAGSTTIAATSESKSDNLVFRVLPPVATVSVTAPADSLGATQTLQATATLKDALGGTINNRPIAWSSSAPGVATVDPATGLITGVSVGSATIRATSEGQTGTLDIHVIVGVNAIAVTWATDSLIGPGTIIVTATATDAGSAPIPGRTLTISSSNPSAATATPTSAPTNGSGQVAITVTSVAPGNSTISATAEGKTGAVVVRMLAPVATVTVTTAGNTIIGTGSLQATTTLADASGNPLTLRPITYSSSDNNIATVDPTTGLITGVAPGDVTITAASEGRTGNVLIHVLASVASVTITPAPSAGDSVIAGFITLQTVVVLRDANNNVLTGRPITYSSSNTSLASVSASGLVSGVGLTAGTASISATSEGITSASPLAIRVLAPVSIIVVTAPDSSVDVGNSVTATAIVKDANNNTLTGRPINWSSSSPLIASVGSTTGLITAINPGQISVTAASEGRTGLIALFRSLGPVATVTVAPPTASVAAGNDTPLIATITDAAAFSPNPLPGVSCLIASTNSAAATAPTPGVTDANGQIAFNVHGVAAGTAQIRVSCSGKLGTSDITVTP